MADEICKHCSKPIVLGHKKFSGLMWLTKGEERECFALAQYCWVDPAGGSQLHEPVKKEYTKKYNNVAEHWKVLDPDGKLVIVVDTESEANSLLTHLNRG